MFRDFFGKLNLKTKNRKSPKRSIQKNSRKQLNKYYGLNSKTKSQSPHRKTALKNNFLFGSTPKNDSAK